MSDLLFKDEVSAIVGAAMEIHDELGFGFLEPIYQEAMEIELSTRSIPFLPQHEIQIRYKDHDLLKTYKADFLIFNEIIVEIKAIDGLSGREEPQLLNYLKATGLELGLSINFGGNKVEWKRMVRTKNQTIREH